MTKRRTLLTFVLLISALFSCVGGFAQLPEKPYPPRLVNDFVGLLDATQVETLEQKLVAYNDSTSTQFTLVIVDDLQGLPALEYATKIGHAWGAGQKTYDNGAVILVKPKTADSEGKVAISVGYGLEPYITDAVSDEIVRKEMIPYFKVNDYYTGIDNAINAMIGLCSGQFTADEYIGKLDNLVVGAIFIGFFLLIIIIFTLLIRSGSRTYSDDGILANILQVLLLILLSGGGRGGSSGGSGGHGGGGGFGGFGGGGFGGGGASGSW